jgi:transcriptional regulator with XRE-family HTH domain
VNLSDLKQILRIVNDKAVQKTLEEIGQKLRDLRKKKEYTSAESFAYDHDLPRVHYWRIERGKVNLTIKSLHKILCIHGLTIEEFFGVNKKD